MYKREASERFLFIDASRGLAAVGVMLFHLYANFSPLAGPLSVHAPRPLAWLMCRGGYGVAIFFVISGFVIAYSLRHARVTRGSVLRFVVRRHVRLDPPYWASIGVTLACGCLLGAFLKTGYALPNPKVFLAHAVYAQGILGFPNICGVFWTLCLEVQFYLAFILLLWVAQVVHDRSSPPHSRPATLLCALTAAAGAASVLSVAVRGAHVGSPWCFEYFWMFALGVLAVWATLDAGAIWMFGGLVLVVLVVVLRFSDQPDRFAAPPAALAIFLVGRAGHLGDWLRGRAFQYFGRISYSLYLVHYPVGRSILAAGGRITGSSPTWAWAWFAAAVAGSVLVADLVYRLAERPSVQLARHLKAAPALVPPRVLAPAPEAAGDFCDRLLVSAI